MITGFTRQGYRRQKRWEQRVKILSFAESWIVNSAKMWLHIVYINQKWVQNGCKMGATLKCEKEKNPVSH